MGEQKRKKKVAVQDTPLPFRSLSLSDALKRTVCAAIYYVVADDNLEHDSWQVTMFINIPFGY